MKLKVSRHVYVSLVDKGLKWPVENWLISEYLGNLCSGICTCTCTPEVHVHLKCRLIIDDIPLQRRKELHLVKSPIGLKWPLQNWLISEYLAIMGNLYSGIC